MNHELKIDKHGEIKIRNKPLTLHKSIKSPDFQSVTVLVNSPWDYIDMWLKRHPDIDTSAGFFWKQAHHFFEVAKSLPLTSAPLPTFYCFLNAVKALLVVKGINLNGRLRHGVGRSKSQKKNAEHKLEDELIVFQLSGLFTELCKYLDEPIINYEQHTLKEILHNIPYIHRAYTLTYPSEEELFFPLKQPRFVKHPQLDKVWFTAEIEPRYATSEVINNFPSMFQEDPRYGEDKIGVRTKKRFDFKNDDSEGNISRLSHYHRKLRKHIFYINGSQKLWYIKSAKGLNKSSITLTYAAMHRLSELVRYDPVSLDKHLNSQHNWLLSEFIRNAPYQFIDEIASELSGEEFMLPGIALGR